MSVLSRMQLKLPQQIYSKFLIFIILMGEILKEIIIQSKISMQH